MLGNESPLPSVQCFETERDKEVGQQLKPGDDTAARGLQDDCASGILVLRIIFWGLLL